jgi:hypothetical protein
MVMAVTEVLMNGHSTFCEVLLFLSDFYKIWIFLVRKIPKQNFTEFLQAGVEIFHSDVRTDRHDETKILFFFANLKTRLKSIKIKHGPCIAS